MSVRWSYLDSEGRERFIWNASTEDDAWEKVVEEEMGRGHSRRTAKTSAHTVQRLTPESPGEKAEPNALPEFSGPATCKKCGGDVGVKLVRLLRGETHWEVLRRACKACGHHWYEKTLDRSYAGAGS